MPKDAAWPIGFIVGAIVGATLLSMLGATGIVRLLGLFASGVGGGLIADLLYGTLKPPRPPSSGPGGFEPR